MAIDGNRRTVWPLLGYAALAAVALARRERSHRHDDDRPRTRPATGAFGVPRASDEPRAVQHARAKEPGRGRQARSPWQIPWAGWKDIFWRTYAQIGDDRLTAVAAGVVYFGLLALFPAVTAFVSLYGLFADINTVNGHLALAADFLPGGAMDIITDQVARVTAKGDIKLGFGLIIGLGLALWSANAGMKAMIDALNVIYDEKEKRGFIKLNVMSLVFTAGAIVALLLAVGAVVALPLMLGWIGLGSLSEVLLRILRWPALAGVIITGLAVIYRFGPSRDHARWEWLSVGSLMATILWLVSSVLLSWYLESFAHYDATYGSLGAAIGLMLWMWISSIVILLGAELNSEIEHQTARDTTVGAPEPLGQRGAVMADTVGEAAD